MLSMSQIDLQASACNYMSSLLSLFPSLDGYSVLP